MLHPHARQQPKKISLVICERHAPRPRGGGDPVQAQYVILVLVSCSKYQ